MKKVLIIVLLFYCFSELRSQDTLTIMQYNLLNYGNYTSYCTTENNNIDKKDSCLRIIINHVQPDIFAVNEMSKNEDIQEQMLINNLNINNITHYRKADFIKVAQSYLVNQLYYNSNKLVLHSHTIAQSYIRDIDVYEFYYKSDDLNEGDTAFFVCVLAHLKSGNSSTNATKRGNMVQNSLDYLKDGDNTANYIFMGDFNVYKSTEEAYQLLVNNPNSSLKFIDPIDMAGSWNNNSTYRYVHTQSTHANQNGCASHGGMDDRFDQLLVTQSIMDGSEHFQYIDDTYKAIGQDGEHFNKSINDPPINESAPEEVIDALYVNSDHLPVLLKLRVDKTLDILEVDHGVFNEVNYENPFSDVLRLAIVSLERSEVRIRIMDVSGKVVFSENTYVVTGQNTLEFNVNGLFPGYYIMSLTDKDNNMVSRKLVKY